MLLILVVAGLVSGILWYLHHRLTYWQRQGIPTPGLLYQWHYYRRELGPYDVELSRKLGPIYGTYEGLTPILILGDPDLAKDVLVKEFANFPNHKPFRVGIPVVDNNMFSLDGGEDWKRIRSIVSPTFSSGKLRVMESFIVDAMDTLVGHFGKAAQTGAPINVRSYYKSAAFDVTVRCAYGARVDILADPNDPISKQFETMFSVRWEVLVALLLPKLAKMLGLVQGAMAPFNFFENMTKTLIEERKDSTKPKPNDFLQVMIDSNVDAENSETGSGSPGPTSSRKTMSTVEMMAQSLIFLVAGFDTTATIMACSAYYLAKNPQVQARLIAEVEGLSNESKNLTHESVGELKYLDAVLKESFRLSPPFIRVERQCVAATKLGTADVKPGTIVSIPVFAMQRDPKQFSDPEEFDPSRFLEGGADLDHHPYAYIPFGGGPRFCIAQRFAMMTAKMGLAAVMKKFRFEPVPETKLSYTPASLDSLAPKDILLKVKEH